MTAMQQAIQKRDWGHPDAPDRHASGRRCEAVLSECATAEQLRISGQKARHGIVSMYAGKVGGVLLCEPCRRKCLKKNIPPASLTDVEVLPQHGPTRTGFLLPKLGEIREARGMTQYELAREAECSHQYLNSIERERVRPSIALINRIAHAVKVNARDLRGEDSEAA